MRNRGEDYTDQGVCSAVGKYSSIDVVVCGEGNVRVRPLTLDSSTPKCNGYAACISR